MPHFSCKWYPVLVNYKIYGFTLNPIPIRGQARLEHTCTVDIRSVTDAVETLCCSVMQLAGVKSTDASQGRSISILKISEHVSVCDTIFPSLIVSYKKRGSSGIKENISSLICLVLELKQNHFIKIYQI